MPSRCSLDSSLGARNDAVNRRDAALECRNLVVASPRATHHHRSSIIDPNHLVTDANSYSSISSCIVASRRVRPSVLRQHHHPPSVSNSKLLWIHAIANHDDAAGCRLQAAEGGVGGTMLQGGVRNMGEWNQIHNNQLNEGGRNMGKCEYVTK